MSIVAVTKGNALDATLKALELSGFPSMLKRKKRIIIKPNLVDAIPSKKGITTDVKVVEGILKSIDDLSKVKIVEGSSNATAAFKLNGYTKLPKKYGIELIDLDKEGETERVKVSNPLVLKEIEVSKDVLKADFVISVGKLKAHSIARITASLKNMMGICPKKERLRIHAFFPYSLLDLLSIKMPDFGVIDGVVANEMDEHIPHPVKLGIVLASKDCISLDWAASQIIGINPRKVNYLYSLMRRSKFKREKIRIVGEVVGKVRKRFRRREFYYLKSYLQLIMFRPILRLKMDNLIDLYLKYRKIIRISSILGKK